MKLTLESIYFFFLLPLVRFCLDIETADAGLYKDEGIYARRAFGRVGNNVSGVDPPYFLCFATSFRDG